MTLNFYKYKNFKVVYEFNFVDNIGQMVKYKPNLLEPVSTMVIITYIHFLKSII